MLQSVYSETFIPFKYLYAQSSFSSFSSSYLSLRRQIFSLFWFFVVISSSNFKLMLEYINVQEGYLCNVFSYTASVFNINYPFSHLVVILMKYELCHCFVLQPTLKRGRIKNILKEEFRSEPKKSWVFHPKYQLFITLPMWIITNKRRVENHTVSIA